MSNLDDALDNELIIRYNGKRKSELDHKLQEYGARVVRQLHSADIMGVKFETAEQAKQFADSAAKLDYVESVRYAKRYGR